MAMLLKVLVLTLTSRVSKCQGDIISEMDLIASLGEESGGDVTPRLFKVIVKDSEGQFPEEEGWQIVEEDNSLIFDQHFLDQFLDNPEMVQDFEDESLAFVEGTVPLSLSLSGPDQAPSGSLLSFNCHSPSLHLMYPQVDLVWQVTNYSGEAVDFTINDSIEKDEGMTAEISLKADKEDKMLTVQCSLVSDSLFSMDKFMQADVQYYPSEVSITGPDKLQAGIESVVKCKTDESYPAVQLLWRVDGALVEEGVDSGVKYTVNHTVEYTDSGAMEAWSSLLLTVDSSVEEVTVSCEVGGVGWEGELSENKVFQVKGKCWDLLIRNTPQEEFTIPKDFKLVNINVDNFQNFAPQIKHLVTSEVSEQMTEDLVGFAKNMNEDNCEIDSAVVGPETVDDGEEAVFTCNETDETGEVVWQVTSFSGADIPFQTVNSSTIIVSGSKTDKLYNIKCSSQSSEVEIKWKTVNIKYKPTKLKLEGPKRVEPGEETRFNCTTDASYPGVILMWKLNGQLVHEGVEVAKQEIDMEGISTSSFRLITDALASQVTLICFVEGMAMELHRQKLVKIVGGRDTAREEVWQVITRDSIEQEFEIPVGFTLVDVNENNFRNYVSRIKHLITDEIATKMETGLVGFVKSDEGKLFSSKVGDEWRVLIRETVEQDFNIPDGFSLVDINENNFGNYISRIKHLITEEISGKMENDLVGFAQVASNTAMGQPEEDGFSTPIQNNTSDMSCLDSKYQCCPDLVHPQHGYQAYGCCSSTKYGCCPDNISPAPAPYFDGCDCSSTPHGCCPDKLSPADGPDFLGCGCQYSQFGCCLDQQTDAEGPQYEGCGCDTFQFGCCPDGLSIAQGPNMEGCDHCTTYQFGCCEDQLTPAMGQHKEGCGCESSRYGCCLDGSSASGPNYMGCLSVPGENCHLPSQAGSCTEYVDKWFFDLKYGGCSRFWYGGCEPGKNHFDNEEYCNEECTEPRGSAVCFLQKVEGPCKGNYDEWYYDAQQRSCRQFKYGGCLGNGNRFLTKKDCEALCQPRQDEPVCKKPKAEGACNGDHPRWFYNSASGECKQFSYSGCLGNNNRFMSEVECQNTCQHAAKARRSEVTCKQYIEEGNCEDGVNSTLARWGYHPFSRRCVPFYYTGCGGNENNFGSQEECETVCPTTFSPLVQLPDGKQILVMRGQSEAQLAVSIRANPAPTITWSHNGREISKYDNQFSVLDDYSLLITNVGDHNRGMYTVTANNGIGEAPSADIEVVIYPILPSIQLVSDKNIFKPKSDVTIECKIKGYPPPTVQWFKKLHRQRELPLESDGIGVAIDTFQETSISMVSRLVLRAVDEEDTATYRCQAGSATKSSAVSVQYGPGERCVDNPSFRQCRLVVRNRFCANKYYGKFCCRSCTEAGQLPGGGTRN